MCLSLINALINSSICSSNSVSRAIKSIGKLKQLVYLDVSKNRIETVDLDISGCEGLEDLLLSSNMLQQLPDSIGEESSGIPLNFIYIYIFFYIYYFKLLVLFFGIPGFYSREARPAIKSQRRQKTGSGHSRFVKSGAEFHGRKELIHLVCCFKEKKPRRTELIWFKCKNQSESDEGNNGKLWQEFAAHS